MFSNPGNPLRKPSPLQIQAHRDLKQHLTDQPTSTLRSPKLRPRSPPKSRTRIIPQASTAELSLFLELLFEQKRLVHRRKYLKVYNNVFLWLQKDERGFFLGLEVKLLRYFLYSGLKLLRNAIGKKAPSLNKAGSLISQMLCVYKGYFKFLATGLNWQARRDFSDALEEQLNDYPSLDSIYRPEANEDLPEFLELMAGRLGGPELFQNTVNGRSECSFFMLKSLEFVLLMGQYYQKTGDLRLGYCYLWQGHKLAKELSGTVNPDLLGVCSRANLAFIGLVLSLGGRIKAKKLLFQTMVLVEAELGYRMNREPKRHDRMKTRRAVKTLICVLLMLVYCFEYEKDICKISEALSLVELLCGCFLAVNDEFRKTFVKIAKDFKRKYNRFFEETAEINGIVENSLKNDHEFKQKLHPMSFPEEKEPVVLAKTSKAGRLLQHFKGDFIKKKEEKEPVGKPRGASGHINTRKDSLMVSAKEHRQRLSLDLRATGGSLRENKLNMTETTKRSENNTKIRPKTAKIIHKIAKNIHFSNENESNPMKNDVFPVENAKNGQFQPSNRRSISLFGNTISNSFLLSEDDEGNSSLLDADDALNLRNSLLFQEKLGLSLEKRGQSLIRGHFKPFKEDYKPKILTTDEYFLRPQGVKTDSKPVPHNFLAEKEGLLLENLDKYPRKHKFQEKKQKCDKNDYLTVCFQETINETLKAGPWGFRSPKEINKEFLGLLKTTEFDDVEFRFGKKMLEAKRKANLKPDLKPGTGSCFPSTLFLMRRIRNHAENALAKQELQEKVIKTLEKQLFEPEKHVLIDLLPVPGTPRLQNTSPTLQNPSPGVTNNPPTSPRVRNPALSARLTVQQPRTSLVDILVKHKEVFGIENQAKRIEKNQQISRLNREKELEHQHKRSLGLDEAKIPLNSTKRSLLSTNYAPTKPKPSITECQSLTERTNQMVRSQVKRQLLGCEGMIEDLLGDLEPGRRKTKAKRMQERLRNKPFQGLKRQFGELSMSTAGKNKL